jgi:hypothetical protein
VQHLISVGPDCDNTSQISTEIHSDCPFQSSQAHVSIFSQVCDETRQFVVCLRCEKKVIDTNDLLHCVRGVDDFPVELLYLCVVRLKDCFSQKGISCFE